MVCLYWPSVAIPPCVPRLLTIRSPPRRQDKRSCTKGAATGQCAVYPCGLIAWSVYNDTFYSNNYAPPTAFAAPAPGDIIGTGSCSSPTSCLQVERAGATKYVPWSSNGIAWASDREQKFKTTTKPSPVGSAACTGTPTAQGCMAMPYDTYKYFKCADGVSGVNNASCPLAMRYADVSNEEVIIY